MPGQLKDGIPVGIGKTFLRCLPVRQPDRIQMLSRSQDDRKFLRHLKSEYMFRIFCHSRSEPMSPDRKYFENVFDLPVFKTGCGNLMIFRSRHFLDNPDPRFPRKLHGSPSGQAVPTTNHGNRLPIARSRGDRRVRSARHPALSYK